MDNNAVMIIPVIITLFPLPPTDTGSRPVHDMRVQPLFEIQVIGI